MASEPVLVCRGVTKRYRGRAVLEDLDLEIRAGEVFGLLGPNGAGKTTALRMILGLGLPSAGSITLFGQDLFTRRRTILRHVGAVIEAPAFFEYLSGLENLRRLVALTEPVPEERLLKGLDTVGLAGAAGNRVGTYSYGMKQRLGIAQALLPDTRLLILDEPTNGLDPHGIAGMRRLIRDLTRDRQISVLLSSHLLVEVEQVCDRVGIIHQGRCLVQTSVSTLKAESGHVEVDVAGAPERMAELERLSQATELRPRPGGGGGTLVFRPPPDIPDLVRLLTRLGADITRVQTHRESLEDVFLRLTRSGGSDVRVDAF